MTEQHPFKNHHQLASGHHEDAAHYHREASRHFENGKDIEHAAHLSLIAHGHTLGAAAQSDRALAHFARLHPDALPTTPPAGNDAAPLPGGAGPAAYHAAAADHHQQALHHLDRAAKHGLAADHRHAAEALQTAHSHAQQALFRSNEAVQTYSEHYGHAAPVAEIA